MKGVMQNVSWVGDQETVSQEQCWRAEIRSQGVEAAGKVTRWTGEVRTISFKILGYKRDEKDRVMPGKKVSEQRRSYVWMEGSWGLRKPEGNGQVEEEGLLGEEGGRKREAESEREDHHHIPWCL